MLYEVITIVDAKGGKHTAKYVAAAPKEGVARELVGSPAMSDRLGLGQTSEELRAHA